MNKKFPLVNTDIKNKLYTENPKSINDIDDTSKVRIPVLIKPLSDYSFKDLENLTLKDIIDNIGNNDIPIRYATSIYGDDMSSTDFDGRNYIGIPKYVYTENPDEPDSYNWIKNSIPITYFNPLTWSGNIRLKNNSITTLIYPEEDITHTFTFLNNTIDNEQIYDFSENNNFDFKEILHFEKKLSDEIIFNFSGYTLSEKMIFNLTRKIGSSDPNESIIISNDVSLNSITIEGISGESNKEYITLTLYKVSSNVLQCDIISVSEK